MFKPTKKLTLVKSCVKENVDTENMRQFIEGSTFSSPEALNKPIFNPYNWIITWKGSVATGEDRVLSYTKGNLVIRERRNLSLFYRRNP